MYICPICGIITNDLDAHIDWQHAWVSDEAKNELLKEAIEI